jgi:GGDEF domain-containing protein
MLLAVLGAALHLGRRGGLVAAVAASAVYTLMSVPALLAPTTVTGNAYLALVARLCSFGLVGIIGGEAAGRISFALARQGQSDEFDQWGQVFNQRRASSSLQSALAAHENHAEPFAVVLLSLGPAALSGRGPQKSRTLIRSVSGHLRSDVRMSDEVARLDDGRFLVLLHRASHENATAVATRLAEGVRELLGRDRALPAIECYGIAEHALAIKALAERIRSKADDAVQSDQPASGAYSSAGESVLNPAAVSTLSAPGASTLKMSTAARPEGSTKQ